MKILLSLVLFHFFFIGNAQKFTISGYVKDGSSGESLIGASIYDTHKMTGTAANTYGFYSLTLPSDSVALRFSYVGYLPVTIRFLLRHDTIVDIGLDASSHLKEVIVEAGREERIQESSRMGTIDVPIEQIKTLPALLGEVDVLKVIQLLPGVQAGTEGASGLYVRGGGPDQNLILLDGVPVYNASHLFGFFSVFNADAINHVELIKGGFPARYGGRLSSVIDISMKEGNASKIKGEGAIGLIASRLTLEGPIIKDRTSFIVSARRTYIDLLARPIIKATSPGDAVAGYYFYDLNAKVNHRINNTNRIYLSAYLGDDKAYAREKDFYIHNNIRTDFENEFGLRWGNITTALRWNHVVSPKIFSNVTATYSRYRFDIFEEFYEKITTPDSVSSSFFKDQYISGIRDFAFKADFDFIPGPRHYVKFGVQAIDHLFTPGVYNYQGTSEADTTFGTNKIYGREFFVYIEDDFLITDKIKVNAGLHASAFNVQNKFYYSLQPRLSMRYLLTDNLSAKASYAEMTQFIHLLTNAGLGLPTDLWVPATPAVGPEKSRIVSAGLARSFRSDYEISLEGYYKNMDGLIEYKDGASFLNIESDWQTKVERGQGESYGAELLLQKKTGKVSGWLGYTLSWTNRTFANLNFGRTFPYKYDRRHDIELALSYKWKDDRDLSFTWVYGTGNAISLPIAEYFSQSPDHRTRFNNTAPAYYGTGRSLQFYDGRNNYRMRSYHRFDISYSKTKKTKWGERTWAFGVYNLYNRRNPFFMDIGQDKQGNKKFIQYSLFPLIPSVTYRFKF